MKKEKLLGAVMSLLLMASTSEVVLAQDGESPAGTYARTVNSSAPMPAGHFALLAHYADAFLSANHGKGGVRTIYAQDLMDGVDDPQKADELGDYYLLDIRLPADYAAGHIAGAVNVQLGDVANPGVLAMLPIDRPILVICYTGQTASIANAVLAVLGYDAWTLRFGMTSWKASSSTAVWSSSIKQDITGGNYPVVMGTKP
jgi:rhodanese-related sulfurtransferase